MQRTLILLLLAAIVMATSGCLLVAAGAAGAAAVVVTGEDSVETVVAQPMDPVYRESVAQIASRGRSVTRDPEFYRHEGTVDGSRVWVMISPVSSDKTLVRVRARKLEQTLPDRDLARELAMAIALAFGDDDADRDAWGGEEAVATP